MLESKLRPSGKFEKTNVYNFLQFCIFAEFLSEQIKNYHEENLSQAAV